jgi:hypothetical protein
MNYRVYPSAGLYRCRWCWVVCYVIYSLGYSHIPCITQRIYSIFLVSRSSKSDWMNLRNLLNFYDNISWSTVISLVLHTHLLNFLWCQDHQNQIEWTWKFVERLYDNISWSTVISLVLHNAFTPILISEHNFNLWAWVFSEIKSILRD